MEPSFVREQANKLVEIIKDEHKLKVELLHLDLGLQAPESLKKNMDRQWHILGQLRSINMDKKLPIMRALANFISARLKHKA